LESALARVSLDVPPKGAMLEEMSSIELRATDKYPAILSIFNNDEDY